MTVSHHIDGRHCKYLILKKMRVVLLPQRDFVRILYVQLSFIHGSDSERAIEYDDENEDDDD